LPGEALAGLFAIDVNAGTIGYDRADFDFLGAGEQISVVFGFNAQSGPNIVHKTITIFIDGENDPPVSGDDTSVSGTEDDAVIAGSVPPASDIDGDALAFQLVGEAPAGLTFNADGTFSIALLASDQGLDDGETRKFSFDYFANDGTADSAVATVNVTVNGVNDAPLSGGDLLVVGTEDDPIILGAVPAGSDVDGEALTYQLIGGAPAGLTFNPDGTFSVVPLPSDQGMDDGESRQVVFQYIANDGTADSAPATVTVTINGANDAPVALDDSYSITEDMTLVILPLGVLANDSDVDGDTLTAEVFSGPAHGDLIFDLDGSFTYVPDQDFNGEDSFTYVVSDGSAGSNVATVTISVGTENDAPVAAADFYFVAEDDALNIAVGQGVLANDTDADGNPLSAQIVSGPSNGTLVFNTDGSFDYTPFANFNGVDSFVYKANDGGADSSDTVVTINVGSVDDKPSGGGTVALSVEESALDLAADAGDLQPGMVTGSDPTSGAETTSATGGISFTAGEQALSVGFANPSGPNWTAPTILGLAAGYAINWALSAGQLVGTLFQGAVNLGNAIYLALSGQTSASPFAAATPTVTATVTDQLQHAMGADAITISGLPVVATDTSGDNVFATVNLAVGDDEPVANPSENSVFIPDTHSNIVLVIDTSGSMNNPSGVAGLTRLGLVKQSVNTLLDYYDGQGDVSVRIVTFNSAAGTQGDGWLSVAEAKDLVNGLGASGNTNYDAALATAQMAFATDGKIADAQNILYFLSDGDPTIGGGITGAEVQDWQNFLNGNDIYSLAVGLGSGVSAANLHPIAYDGRGEGADTNGTVVANLNQLTSVLVATIPQPIESNILVDGAPDSTFGADGGYVRAIKLGDITYTYDQATNSVTDGAGPLDDATFDAQSHVLTINSAALGTLAIDLDDASYTYTAPSLISGDQAVVYEYTLIDGDGDTDTDTLTISLSIAENSTNAANLAAANFLLHA
jgi:VCBS repeat-containing protein